MPFTIHDELEAPDALLAGLFQTDFEALTLALNQTSVVSGLAVTATGAGLGVSMAVGTLQVAGVQRQIQAPQTATLGAASADPRLDLLTVSDAGVLTVTAGTAHATQPTPPSVPANHVPLAFAVVRPGTTTLTAAMLADKRVVTPAHGAFTVEPRLDGLQEFRRIGGKELRSFRPALAARETQPTNIYFLGDSMSEGYGQTSYARRWMDIARDSLQREYRPGGEGFIPARSGITPMTFPSRWTVTGAVINDDYGWGLGRRAVFMDTVDDGIQLSSYCDRFWVLYTQGPGTGSFQVTIDGVAQVAQSSTASITLSGRIWESPLLQLGTHTILIKPTSGAAVIDGVMLFATDRDGGIHVWDGSHSGFHADHLNGDLTTDDTAPANAGKKRYWADVMFQPHTTVAIASPNIAATGNNVLNVTGGTFTANDIGEVIFTSTSVPAFPRNLRITAVNSATQVVVNQNVPSGTYGGAHTRARYTDGVTYVSAGNEYFLDSATAAFAQWDTGKTIKGTNIPTGTYIRRVVSATRVELSQKASAAGTGQTFQITNRQKYDTRPHLLALEFGFNEESQSQFKSVYKANLEAVVATAIAGGCLDDPSMTGVYTDETPSVCLIGLWAHAYQATNVVIPVSITNGSAVIGPGTFGPPRFTQADVGVGISGTGIPGGATIQSVQNPEQATLSAAATATNANLLATLATRTWQDEQWQDFRAAMFELAEAKDWRFFDLYTLGGWVGQYDLRRLTSDGIHANDRGAQWIADEFTQSIGGVKKLASIPAGIFDAPGEMIVAGGADLARKVPGKKILTANVTNSASAEGSFTPLIDLVFPIGPGETLTFLLSLQYFAAATTTGLALSFSGPTSPVWFLASGIGPGGTSGTSVQFRGVNAYNAILTFGSALGTAATAPTGLLVFGSIKANSQGGLVAPRLGSEVNGSLVTLLAGSSILVL